MTFTNLTTINTEQLADGIYFYESRNSKRIIKNGKGYQTLKRQSFVEEATSQWGKAFKFAQL